VEELQRQGVPVIKALFTKGYPSLSLAEQYRADAFLVECAGEGLPGGNGRAWNWDLAKGFPEGHPLILAGGLTAQNVSEAIQAVCPSAVDVSTGVETRPGEKDLAKVKLFLEAVRRSNCSRKRRRIFP
jgi:phosphoribosylanthranilate isomerase